MLKAIFVYENRQSELLPRFLELFFNSQKGYMGNGGEVLNLIELEKPKLVFFDFEKTYESEGDIDYFLSNLNPEIQLHTSVIKISPANFIFYKVISQRISEFFKDHFGHHHKGSGIQEAYGKR